MIKYWESNFSKENIEDYKQLVPKILCKILRILDMPGQAYAEIGPKKSNFPNCPFSHTGLAISF